MRVYIPSTPAALAAVHRAGEVGAPFAACAVTAALREWYVSDDSEELEYAAMEEAARTSLRLLAAEYAGGDGDWRRVVLAADVPDAEVVPEPAAGRGAVRVSSAVPLRRIASVHADAEDAADDLKAAAGALSAADAGDDDAQFTVDGAEDHELLWYATQELPDVIGGR